MEKTTKEKVFELHNTGKNKRQIAKELNVCPATVLYHLNAKNEDLIECLECHKKLRTINHTHLKIHNLTFEEYKNKFPEAKTTCESTLKALSNTSTGREITWKDKISESNKQAYLDNPSGWGRTGKPASKETLEKMRSSMLALNITCSEETRKKISERTKEQFKIMNYIPWNKNLTKHNCEKIMEISLKNTGKECSEATKARLSEINTGKKHSEETKKSYL